MPDCVGMRKEDSPGHELKAWDGSRHATSGLLKFWVTRNKMAMHGIANRYKLEDWRCGLNPVALFEEWKNWKNRGIRPANHPRTRLQQYGRMIAGMPNWPEKLRKLEVTQKQVRRAPVVGSFNFSPEKILAPRDNRWKFWPVQK